MNGKREKFTSTWKPKTQPSTHHAKRFYRKKFAPPNHPGTPWRQPIARRQKSKPKQLQQHRRYKQTPDNLGVHGAQYG
jgi:hypothetical protein